MNAEASAVRRSGLRRGAAAAGGAITFTLSVGVLATLAAAFASMLVDSVLAKRILWVAVAVAVAVSAGVWRAGYGTTTSPPGSDRPRYDSPAGPAE